MCREIARQDVPHKTKRKQKSEEYLKYQRYIKSDKFDEVKEIVKERDGHKCMMCGRTEEDFKGKKITFHVHHRSYSNLFKGGEEEASDCIEVCNVCHKAIHSAVSNYQRFKLKKGESEDHTS